MRNGPATKFIIAAVLAAALASHAGEIAKPANYPSKPIEIIVPFAPGGGLDTTVRLLGKYVEREVGQRVIVRNRTAGGNLRGNLEGIQAAPDGYTIGAWVNGIVTDQLVVKGAPYTYQDVQPLSLIAEDAHVIVVNRAFARERNIRDLRGLFDYARANPGKVTIGVGGNWTTHDFIRLEMEEQAGVKFNRMPFLGGAPALQAVADGNCDIAVPFPAEVLSQKRNSDRILLLAVTLSARLPQLPDVPTTSEAGYPDLLQKIWRCLTLPKGTPPDIVAYLDAVIGRTLSDPEFQNEAAKLGLNPEYKNSGELTEFLAKEHQRFAEKTRKWGVRIG